MQGEWFADSAFNAGLAAAKAGDRMSAAVLFGVAGTFYGSAVTPNMRSLDSRMVRALLMQEGMIIIFTSTTSC